MRLLVSVRISTHVFIKRKRVFISGIQPSGKLHIGNYLGFLKKFVEIQDSYPNDLKYLSIADLHALTVGFPESSKLNENIVSTAATLLACGVDPDKTVFFQQSQVPEHTLLLWLLGNMQTLAFLQRIPQFKHKSQQVKAVTLGLLSYPVLQAADILVYKGTYVPVGDDQNQHINVAKHLAIEFNRKFKTECFPIPEEIKSVYARIKNLKDASKKMSKSDAGDWCTLYLTDEKDQIHAKCKRAQSDFDSSISYDPERPAICNLIRIYSAFTDKSTDEVVNESKGYNTQQFKEALAVVIDLQLSPIRNKYKELLKDESSLRRTLKTGSERSRDTAQKTVSDVKKIIGLMP